MARFINKTTKVAVNVDDSKAGRFPADQWDADDTNTSIPSSGYAGQKVAELRDEIARRNAERPEDGQLSAEGNKADLVATLEAADAAAE